VVEQGWGDQWNTMRPEGTSYYLSQILAGTTPVAGDLLPSGTWAWNLDLFATEPRLISTDPQTAEFVLRPDAVCSDGVAISVAHFRFNWFHKRPRRSAQTRRSARCFDVMGEVRMVRSLTGRR
jgi:hypothetical protein